MKNVSYDLQFRIVVDYLENVKYKDIMKRYGVNRWNVQDALSKLGVKTDRIKSSPRLPGGKKNKTLPLAPIEYHDIDLLPPIKPKENNPVLSDDLDYMERYNLEGIDSAQFENDKYIEIDVSENDEIRYIERE